MLISLSDKIKTITLRENLNKFYRISLIRPWLNISPINLLQFYCFDFVTGLIDDYPSLYSSFSDLVLVIAIY